MRIEARPRRRPRRRRPAPRLQRCLRRRAAALAASRTALPTHGELRLARRATAPSPREAAPPLQPSRRRCCAARPDRLGRTSRWHQEASGRGQHGAGLQRSRISYVLARAWSRPCRGLPTGERGYSHTAPAEGSECCHRKERSAGLACAWNDGHPTRWQGAGGSTSIAHPGCQHSHPKRGVPPVREPA